jgi:hypothetical protein
MEKFIFLLFFSFIINFSNAQSNNGFSWQISGCCVKVVVAQGYMDFCPFWQINLGGNLFDSSTNPDGVINYCFSSNGNYVTILSGCSPSYVEVLKIENCGGAQQNCFESVTIDECCVTVVVCNSPPPREWNLDFGD